MPIKNLVQIPMSFRVVVKASFYLPRNDIFLEQTSFEHTEGSIRVVSCVILVACLFIQSMLFPKVNFVSALQGAHPMLSLCPQAACWCPAMPSSTWRQETISLSPSPLPVLSALLGSSKALNHPLSSFRWGHGCWEPILPMSSSFLPVLNAILGSSRISVPISIWRGSQ